MQLAASYYSFRTSYGYQAEEMNGSKNLKVKVKDKQVRAYAVFHLKLGTYGCIYYGQKAYIYI